MKPGWDSTRAAPIHDGGPNADWASDVRGIIERGAAADIGKGAIVWVGSHPLTALMVAALPLAGADGLPRDDQSAH